MLIRRDRCCSTGRHRALAAHGVPARADRRPPGRRRRHRRRQGRGRPVAAAVPVPPRGSPARWAAGRAAACCSRAARAPARPTPPRRWRPRPACRSCSPPRRRSSPASREHPAQGAPVLPGAAQGGAQGRRRGRLHRRVRRDRHGAPGTARRDGAGAGVARLALLGCGGLEGLPMPWRPSPGRDQSARRSSAAATCRWRSTSCSCRCSRSTSRPAAQKVLGRLVDMVNLLLPLRHRQLRGPVDVRQHPADRLDQPGRLARPGAAAARPVRPAAHLRAAREDRPPRS